MISKRIKQIICFVIGVFLSIFGFWFALMIPSIEIIEYIWWLVFIVGIILCWGAIYGIYQDYKVRKKKNEL